jgi:hypothetical protein
MAIRYFIGDALFNELIKFRKGEFILTQVYYEFMSSLKSRGNLLYPFYDNPPYGITTDTLQHETRIRTRTVFNHGTYPTEYPGGVARLHNVTQIDGNYVVFAPGAPNNILSQTELEQRLVEEYDEPQDFMDSEKVWHDGTIAEEAEKYAHYTLNEHEWKKSQREREMKASRFHLIFNFQRLIRCLSEAQEARLNEAGDGDVLSRARKMKTEHLISDVQRLMQEG